jgi:hypothetical protein
MPALPEVLVLAIALLALWAAQHTAIDAHGALAAGDAPLDDAVLYALV